MIDDGVIQFRQLAEDDLDTLAVWLGRAHVQAWWKDPSAPADVRKKYVPRIRGESPTEVFVVSVAGADVGMIQRYRLADHPDWLDTLARAAFDAPNAAGIDYLLGDPAAVGHGVGTAMISGFTDKLFTELDDVDMVAVTPQAANVASCRALEKAGYERRWVGMLDSDDPADAGEAALYTRHRSSASTRSD